MRSAWPTSLPSPASKSRVGAGQRWAAPWPRPKLPCCVPRCRRDPPPMPRTCCSLCSLQPSVQRRPVQRCGHERPALRSKLPDASHHGVHRGPGAGRGGGGGGGGAARGGEREGWGVTRGGGLGGKGRAGGRAQRSSCPAWSRAAHHASGPSLLLPNISPSPVTRPALAPPPCPHVLHTHTAHILLCTAAAPDGR